MNRLTLLLSALVVIALAAPCYAELIAHGLFDYPHRSILLDQGGGTGFGDVWSEMESPLGGDATDISSGQNDPMHGCISPAGGTKAKAQSTAFLASHESNLKPGYFGEELQGILSSSPKVVDSSYCSLESHDRALAPPAGGRLVHVEQNGHLRV